MKHALREVGALTVKLKRKTEEGKLSTYTRLDTASFLRLFAVVGAIAIAYFTLIRPQKEDLVHMSDALCSMHACMDVTFCLGASGLSYLFMCRW